MLLAVYWGPRPTPLDDAVTLTVRACAALSTAGYSELRHKGRSRKEAEKLRFSPDEKSVTQLLSRSVNRRDVDKTQMPELGYSFGLWSGGPDELAYEFSGHIGNSTQIGKNCLLLRIPSSGPVSHQANESAVLALFSVLVQLCQAEQGIICEPAAVEWVGQRLSPHISSKARYPNEA
jgi:hypothetical protein